MHLISRMVSNKEFIRIYPQLGKKGGRLSWKNISAKEYITNEKQATQRDGGR